MVHFLLLAVLAAGEPQSVLVEAERFPEFGGLVHDSQFMDQAEYIRDWNFRAMYGVWDALKNVDNAYLNHRLNWAAHVAGKRESRQLLGDVVLTKEDLLESENSPTAASRRVGRSTCTWRIPSTTKDLKRWLHFQGVLADIAVARLAGLRLATTRPGLEKASRLNPIDALRYE
jgi:hypothetical protein